MTHGQSTSNLPALPGGKGSAGCGTRSHPDINYVQLIKLHCITHVMNVVVW